jgi:hypothetical protein
MENKPIEMSQEYYKLSQEIYDKEMNWAINAAKESEAKRKEIIRQRRNEQKRLERLKDKLNNLLLKA